MNSDNQTPNKSKGSHDNVIDGIILTAVSLILALILFGAFGKAGNYVADFLCGIFGYAIYGITFGMLTIGALRFFNYTPNARITTIIGAVLIFILFILIFQVVTSKEYLAGYGAYLKSCYTQANTAGGALFGLIVYPVAKLNDIFAIVLFSLLLVGAFVLTFFVQITKMPIFKAISPKIRDSQFPINQANATKETKEITSDLNISLIDGRVPSDKIGKTRKQTGHESIRSIEELDRLNMRGQADEDVVVLQRDQQVAPKKLPKPTSKQDLQDILESELPPCTIEEVDSAISRLGIGESKPEPKNIVDGEYDRETAARLLYDADGLELKRAKKKIEFTDEDRTYTSNYKTAQIEENLKHLGHGDKQHSVQDGATKPNTNAPSVSQQISEVIKQSDDEYYTAVDEDDTVQKNIEPPRIDNLSVGGSEKPCSLATDPYAELNSQEAQDLTARGTEATESFADKLQHEESLRIAKEQEEKAKARTFKDELQRRKEELERKRKERSDKGGSHVNPSVAIPEYTAPTFGRGVNFGLPNTDSAIEKPIVQVKNDEKRATVAEPNAPYKAPPIALLNNYIATPPESEDFSEKIDKLEETLRNFGIDAKVVNIVTGPTFTRLELQMPAGISVSKINTYANDISMCLEAESVRLQTPIPGKNLFGVELPNKSRGVVGLKDLFNSPKFNNNKHAISFAVGQDCDGEQYVIDLAKTPHMLIAGATGAGKSVCINTLICSIIYKYSPSEVKLALVDPKQVELSRYNGLPHLLVEESIYAKDKVINLLDWTIDEMEARYSLLKSKRSTGIVEFNDLAAKNGEAKLPYIVVIIDEVSDIVMSFKKEFEERVVRIAQKARAAGIVLILATQRPSVDVITGIIKANLPSRMAFAVASQVDSKTILDVGGAEKLLRNGDMLYVAGTDPRPVRIQGAFVSNEEVNAICEYVRANNVAEFDEAIAEAINRTKQSEAAKSGGGEMVGMSSAEKDKMFVLCLKYVIETGDCSSSKLMRRYGLGFQRAARLVDTMVELGYVAKLDNKKYEISLSMEEFMRIYGDFDLS